MSTLFKSKPEAEKRNVRIPVRCTQAEADDVRRRADMRQMTVSEFMRRTALGRRADVDYETEIILGLRAITNEIRRLHGSMVERGETPPEEALLRVIVEVRKAMLKISNWK